MFLLEAGKRLFGASGNDESRKGPQRAQPGSAPGIEFRSDVEVRPADGEIPIAVITMGDKGVEQFDFGHVDQLLAWKPAEGMAYYWINVTGVNAYVINKLREHYAFDTLIAEDIMNSEQRAKAEAFSNGMFAVMRMNWLQDGVPLTEQVNFLLLPCCVISVQEQEGDVFNSIRSRMRRPGSRFQKMGAPYLFYALVDAVVDHQFPVMDFFMDTFSLLEVDILEGKAINPQEQIHGYRKELTLLMRALRPMREMVDLIASDPENILSAKLRPFWSDVHDHVKQLIDQMDVCRETARGLHELHISLMSNRMNEVMKVLTVLASFFIPVTFVAGIYGMNFQEMPELSWRFGYGMFWVICGVMTSGLFIYFKKKGWL